MTENSMNELGTALIEQARVRLLDESLPRIQKCLSKLSDEEIWYRPNEETVSIGNLVLHLCGNVRQWIIAGLGGAPDNRTRDEEFSETGPLPRGEIEKRIDETVKEAMTTLESLDPGSLLQPRHVQGQDETGVSIIVHVVEHFSYHTGEITFAVKSRKAIDLGYYDGADNLNRTG